MFALVGEPGADEALVTSTVERVVEMKPSSVYRLDAAGLRPRGAVSLSRGRLTTGERVGFVARVAGR